jgi:uncharacterized protein (TIGR00730 family)
MNICVFCGSATGENPVYADAARELGRLLASNSHNLVYGGGNIGLMGILADSVIQHKGEVIGIIPDFLAKREVAHNGISKLEVVSSMHERKKRMADLSHAFIAMPGGWGTLDELAEILTWRQLGIVNQPIGLLNVNKFFDPLLEQMRLMVEEKFLKVENLDLLFVEATPAKLLYHFDRPASLI